jgi:hypothetical protein
MGINFKKKISGLITIFFVVIIFNITFLVYSYIYFHTVTPIFIKPAIQDLVTKVIQASKKENFKKGVFSDKIKIDGDDFRKEEDKKYLEQIITTEITSELISNKDSPFNMIVSPEDYELWVKRIEESLRTKNYKPSLIWEIVRKLRSTAELLPDYVVELKWFWVKGKKGKLINLSCVVRETKTQKRIPAQSVVLFSPQYETKVVEKQKVLLVWNKIAIVTVVVSLIILVGIYIYSYTKIREVNKNLPSIIEKLEKYLTSGSYVASSKLLNEILYYLPENTDLVSIQSRLDNITKKNYEEAEKSYIRFTNLKTKLEQTGFLTDEEYDELTRLPQNLDLPEINTLIGMCQKKFSVLKLSEEIRKKFNEISLLLSTGLPQQAKLKLYNLQKDPSWQDYQLELKNQTFKPQQEIAVLPLPQQIDELKTQIEEKIVKSKENFDKAKELILKGEIKQSKSLLTETLELDKELVEAQELMKKIKKSEETKKLKLVPEKVGKEILIFKKDIITFARKENEIPDVEINNPRISRDKHLKLCVVENKLIAEDMNSTNGTYHCGKKISKVEVLDGDILDLAHIYKMTVHIFRSQEIVRSTLVSGTIPQEMFIDQQIVEQQQKIGGIFIEAEDKSYIILPNDNSAVSIDFKPIGIVYDKSGSCRISVNENVLLLNTSEGCQILYPGGEISYKGVRYKII